MKANVPAPNAAAESQVQAGLPVGSASRRVMPPWVVAVVIGLGISGCGGSAPSKPTPVSLSAAVSKTKRIATGRVTETFSASQGGQSLSLFTYRDTFDNPQKLPAATVDYRNIVANNGGVLGVAGVPHVLLPEEVTGEGAR